MGPEGTVGGAGALARALPFVLVGAVLALMAVAYWLELPGPDDIAIAVVTAWLGVQAGIAALIARRRPGNPIGWLFLAASAGIAVHLAATAYAKQGIRFDPGSLPFAGAAAWLTLWLSVPFFFLFVHIFLRFPDGRLLPGPWRWLSPATTASAVLTSLAAAFKPGPVDSVPEVDNPLAFGWAGALYRFMNETAGFIIVAIVLCSIASLLVRLRRSTGAERQQLKVFAYGVVLFPVLFLAAMAIDAVLDPVLGPGDHYVDFLLIMAGALLIPVSMAVSILRYRLYEIDVIINRTLVYGALTAVLVGTYAGLVVAMQALLSGFTPDSDLAVAASTLAVAGLFRPLKARIQVVVDRRFYRRRYDARRALERFSVRLRDEVELETIEAELRSVLAATIQPAHAALWLCPRAARARPG